MTYDLGSRVSDWRRAGVTYSARVEPAVKGWRRKRHGCRVLIMRHFGNWRTDLSTDVHKQSRWLPDETAAQRWADREMHALSRPPGAPLGDQGDTEL